MATVQKWGNSLGVRIPKDVAARAGVSDGSLVRVKAEPGKIIFVRTSRASAVVDHRIPRYSLKELLKGVTPENLNRDTEWLDAPPVGREVV